MHAELGADAQTGPAAEFSPVVPEPERAVAEHRRHRGPHQHIRGVRPGAGWRRAPTPPPARPPSSEFRPWSGGAPGRPPGCVRRPAAVRAGQSRTARGRGLRPMAVTVAGGGAHRDIAEDIEGAESSSAKETSNSPSIQAPSSSAMTASGGRSRRIASSSPTAREALNSTRSPGRIASARRAAASADRRRRACSSPAGWPQPRTRHQAGRPRPRYPVRGRRRPRRTRSGGDLAFSPSSLMSPMTAMRRLAGSRANSRSTARSARGLESVGLVHSPLRLPRARSAGPVPGAAGARPRASAARGSGTSSTAAAASPASTLAALWRPERPQETVTSGPPKALTAKARPGGPGGRSPNPGHRPGP